MQLVECRRSQRMVSTSIQREIIPLLSPAKGLAFQQGAQGIYRRRFVSASQASQIPHLGLPWRAIAV